MKLSRRGKRVICTRRGRHTKRVRKHHTRRIKHRGKQYKRTYRKNNRKLKHNKRIQRGGWEWMTYDNINYNASGVQLNYNNSSKNSWWETNPFTITLKYEGSDNDVYKFTVTMTRNTMPERKFELYFKLQSDNLYFSDTGPDFEISQNNRFGVLYENKSAFKDFLQFKTTYQVKYQFNTCLLYTSPSPRDRQKSRMPSSA